MLIAIAKAMATPTSQLAIGQSNQVVCISLRKRALMSHHNQRHSKLPVAHLQQLQNPASRATVEIACRLIGQKQAGAIINRGCCGK